MSFKLNVTILVFFGYFFLTGISLSAETSSKFYKYTIKNGDTIEDIAWILNVSQKELSGWNPNISFNDIKPGQMIKYLPHNKFHVYIVQKGDTISRITKALNVSGSDLLKWNQDMGIHNIYPGDKIKYMPQEIQLNEALSALAKLRNQNNNIKELDEIKAKIDTIGAKMDVTKLQKRKKEEISYLFIYIAITVIALSLIMIMLWLRKMKYTGTLKYPHGPGTEHEQTISYYKSKQIDADREKIKIKSSPPPFLIDDHTKMFESNIDKVGIDVEIEKGDAIDESIDALKKLSKH